MNQTKDYTCINFLKYLLSNYKMYAFIMRDILTLLFIINKLLYLIKI